MNPLTDLIPAKSRKYVYAAATLASLGFAAWEAAHGDWTKFAEGLAGSLVSGLAHANTSGD